MRVNNEIWAAPGPLAVSVARTPPDDADDAAILARSLAEQFMGSETIAVRAHVSVGTDGTHHIKAGQVLGWMALLATAIVDRPGQLP